jgi:hypothetical protein
MMTGFWRRLWKPWMRRFARSATAPRSRNWYQAEVVELDQRVLLTPGVTGFNAKVEPNVLVPPNGRFVPVTISGQVAATTTTPPTGFFYVTDEYRELEPRGVFAVGPGQPFIVNGTPSGTIYPYSVTIFLQAQRSSDIPDGRHYYILVGARTPENNMSTTLPVIVPLSPVPPKHSILDSTIQQILGFHPRPRPTPPARPTPTRPTR